MVTFNSVTRNIDSGQVATVAIRFYAMLVHLIGTFAIAAFTYLLIRQIWFPRYFWDIAGGAGLFVLICSVDAILGPALTFVVFNPAKGRHRLRFDLAAIFLMQLVALIYGLWSVAEARPLFLAYSVDRFDLVTAADLSASDFAKAEFSEYRTLSLGRPRIIGTREPRNGDEKLELIDSALSGRDRHLLPKTYIPFEQVRLEMLARARSLQSLKSANVDNVEAVSALERRFGTNHEKLAYVPIIAKGDWIMVIDANTGEFLEASQLNGL